MIVKKLKNLLSLNNNHSLIIRFMISYLIILLIPVFIGTLVYQEAITIVEDETKASSLSMLNQCRDIIDQQLSIIDVMKVQIGLLPQLNSALQSNNREKPEFYFEMNRLMNQLRPHTINNSFVMDFFIYLNKPEYIIGPSMAYDAPFFFEKIFRIDGFTKMDWLKELGRYHSGSALPVSKVILENNTYFLIPYLHSLPVRYSKKVEGAIVFLLDAGIINKMLSRLSSMGESKVYIVNGNNQIIAGLTPDKPLNDIPHFSGLKREGFSRIQLNGEELIATYTTSPYNGWKYVSILPFGLVMQKVIYIKRIVSSFIILSLIIGAIISYFLTSRNIEPLKKIINQIKNYFEGDPPKERDAFKYLQGSISQLINNNQRLKEEIKNYQPIIKTAFFDRLFRGDYNNYYEIHAISSYLGIQIKGEKFIVLLLRLYSQDDIFYKDIIEESHLAKAALRKTLSKQIGSKGFFHDMDRNNIAILLTFKNISDQECVTETERLIRTVSEEVFDKYKLRVFFGGGSIFSNLLMAWQSCEEARRSLEYSISSGTIMVWYWNITSQGDEYYYPIDYEQKIMNLVKTGELKQVVHLLDFIYRENCENRKLSREMSLELNAEMKGTIVKLASQLQFTSDEIMNLINNVNCSKPFTEFFQDLICVYKNICQRVVANRKWRNVQLKENIIEFINNAYHQSDFCLSKVASQFGLSEGYLSHFFKDQVGENFFTYLEKIRIEQACELLNDKGITVNDVADRVGYNSVYSFRRAFKRVKGVNPTTYRSS